MSKLIQIRNVPDEIHRELKARAARAGGAERESGRRRAGRTRSSLIVIDASAVVELLLVGRHAAAVQDRIEAERGTLHAPHIIDIEVAQVLRRFYTRGELTAERGRAALTQRVRAARDGRRDAS